MSKKSQYCRECGTSIPAGVEKCPKCGHPISKVAQTPTKPTVDAPKSTRTQKSASGDVVPMSDRQPGDYHIADGFLINTKTGDVWKYDESSSKFKVVEKEDSLLTSADKAKAYLNRSEDFAQLANLDLQTRQQREQEVIQTLSNVSKMMHDEAKSIIRNMK